MKWFLLLLMWIKDKIMHGFKPSAAGGSKISIIQLGYGSNTVLKNLYVVNGVLRNDFSDKISNYNYNSITEIGDYAFDMKYSRNTKLTGTISFPSLISIGSSGMNYAFLGCTGLTSISFPKLTSIDSYGMCDTFRGCNNITGTVAFPKLTSIGSYGMEETFYDCSGITSISFPTLTSIGSSGMYNAFYYCTGIVGSLSFPSLISIGSSGMNYAFRACTGLTSVSFPALTTAGVSITGAGETANPLYRCFFQCTGITRVRFPASFSTYSSYLTKEVLFGGTSSTHCNANLQITFDL